MPKKLNLKNKRFGRLTVIKESGHSNGRRKLVLWLCKCDCGNESVVIGDNLVRGHTQSCGCYRNEKVNERRRLDLAGQKFGYLTVMKDVGNNKEGRSQWLCRCKCGNEVVVLGYRLIHGHTKSCSCLSRETTSKRSRKNIIGQKFGRLTVVEFSCVRDEASYWLCKCDCGNECVVVCRSLTGGNTKSCGCLHREVVSGENNHWWIKDRSKLISSLKYQVMYSFEYNQWRKQIFERDGCVCQRCGGNKGGNLHAHHIIPFKKIINHYSVSTIEEAKNCDLLFDIDNGVTLCGKCHMWIHSNKNMNKKFIRGFGTRGRVQKIWDY